MEKIFIVQACDIKSLEVARRCSLKKVFLEILQNSQENTFSRVSFLIKLQAGLQYVFIKVILNWFLFIPNWRKETFSKWAEIKLVGKRKTILYKNIAWRFDSRIIFFPRFRRHNATANFQIVFRTLEAKAEFRKLKSRPRI